MIGIQNGSIFQAFLCIDLTKAPNRNFLLGSVTIGTDMVVDRPAGATLEQRAG